MSDPFFILIFCYNAPIMKQEYTMAVYGKNPFKEVLAKCKREKMLPVTFIGRLLITKEVREDREKSSIIDRSSIRPEIVTYQEIESIVGRGTHHQGICAFVSPASLYTPLEDVLSSAENEERTLLVLLDELEDPHNVGAIIRSAVAFGAKAVLIPDHRSSPLTDTVIKTSSGLNFALPVVKIGNVNTLIEKLKEKRFWVYGLAMEGKTSLTKNEYDAKSLLVIGSEGKGMREKTEELCDFTLSIPMNEVCESLNASVAASVALYEWKRQSE